MPTHEHGGVEAPLARVASVTACNRVSQGGTSAFGARDNVIDREAMPLAGSE
jgi:hypothetical protein